MFYTGYISVGNVIAVMNSQPCAFLMASGLMRFQTLLKTTVYINPIHLKIPPVGKLNIVLTKFSHHHYLRASPEIFILINTN